MPCRPRLVVVFALTDVVLRSADSAGTGEKPSTMLLVLPVHVRAQREAHANEDRIGLLRSGRTTHAVPMT
jgi:hypothetical protein